MSYQFRSASRHFIKDRSPLTDAQIMAVAPSVFASAPIATASSKYVFMPTAQIVEGMRKAGWLPVEAQEQRVRSEARQGHQRHLVRFMHVDQIGKIQEYTPEILLMNSHDAASAYRLECGIFKLACANGLVVADSQFAAASVMHTGTAFDEIIDITAEVVESAPKLAEAVEGFRSRQLTATEQIAFATGALVARYDDVKESPVSPETLLTPKRREDGSNDLWATLNRVQENLIQGGQRDWRHARNTEKATRRSRKVNSITEDVRLNKALWAMAEALKAGNVEQLVTA